MSAYSSIAKLLKAKAAVYNIEISSKGVLGCMHHNAKTGRCQPFREKEPVFFVFCGDREKQAGKTIGKKQAIHV